jgi:hypothetical protein
MINSHPESYLRTCLPSVIVLAYKKTLITPEFPKVLKAFGQELRTKTKHNKDAPITAIIWEISRILGTLARNQRLGPNVYISYLSNIFLTALIV